MYVCMSLCLMSLLQLWRIKIYRVGQKTGPLRFTAYNFRNIDQIFTKFDKTKSLHSELNIMP